MSKWSSAARDRAKIAMRYSIFSAPARYSIERIEPKLHRICLSGKYNYEEIVEGLGRIKDDTQNNTNHNYDKKYIRKVPNFNLGVFVNPKIQCLPPCYIQIVPTFDIPQKLYKEVLELISSALPNIKVSIVEYAIDIYCYDPESTMDLFNMICRCLYVPNTKGWQLFQTQISDNKRKNCVLKIYGDNKVYERGDDNKKNDSGWITADINRVRLEHTAKREELRKKGIATLDAFIQTPKFFQINQNKWQFKEFTGKDAPKAYERTDLYCADYKRLKERVKNPSQHHEDFRHLTDFRYQLLDAMASFDEWWAAI